MLPYCRGNPASSARGPGRILPMRLAKAWRRRGMWATAATLVVPGTLAVAVAVTLLSGGLSGLGAAGQVVTGPSIPGSAPSPAGPAGQDAATTVVEITPPPPAATAPPGGGPPAGGPPAPARPVVPLPLAPLPSVPVPTVPVPPAPAIPALPVH